MISPRTKVAQTSTGEIKLFPGTRLIDGSTRSFFSEDVITKLMSETEFEEKLKDMVEGYIADYLLNQNLTLQSFIDDPFDAIYLADLQPDSINMSTSNELNSLKNIVDLSDTISFNDGWDD